MQCLCNGNVTIAMIVAGKHDLRTALKNINDRYLPTGNTNVAEKYHLATPHLSRIKRLRNRTILETIRLGWLSEHEGELDNKEHKSNRLLL